MKISKLRKTVSFCTRLPCNVHKGNRTIHQLQLFYKQKKEFIGLRPFLLWVLHQLFTLITNDFNFSANNMKEETSVKSQIFGKFNDYSKKISNALAFVKLCSGKKINVLLPKPSRNIIFLFLLSKNFWIAFSIASHNLYNILKIRKNGYPI